MNDHILPDQLARCISRLEPVWLLLMLAAFWQPSPERDRWFWMLAVIPMFMAARWVQHRRLWTVTPLDGLLLAFIGLALLNVFLAPYRRSLDALAAFLVTMGRPLLGMALAIWLVETARQRGSLDWPLRLTTLLALLLAALALTSTQWNSKSDQLAFFIDLLPRFAGAPIAPGGFNANEIAGAMAWLTPVMAGLAIHRWRLGLPGWGVTAAFASLFVAIFLGQSRLALLGVLAALALLSVLLIPRGRWRCTAWAALLAVALLEALIVLHVFNPPNRTRGFERDESSLTGRLDMWRSALDIVYDYPLTGVGMSMYRSGPVRQRYPVSGYETQPLPHAHNEWLQLATDLGLPGLLMFIGWQVTAAYMLWRAWKQGDPALQATAAAVAAGLLAHAVFGLGDAIALWDRFSFLFWWLLGLAAAAYTLARSERSRV